MIEVAVDLHCEPHLRGKRLLKKNWYGRFLDWMEADHNVRKGQGLFKPKALRGPAYATREVSVILTEG